MSFRTIRSFALVLVFITTVNSLKADELLVAFEKDTVFSNISTIRVKGYYSKILVERSTEHSVRIRAMLKSTKPEGYSIVTKVTNKTLEVIVSYPQKSWSSHTGELVFYVPDSIKIDIENTSGYCTINEVFAKTISVSTKSGKININKCVGNLILSSSTGNINVDEVKGSANVKTKSADLSIYRVTGDVISYSSSGMLRLDNITGDVKTASTSGKQEMDNIKGDIVAKSMSGPIKISVSEGAVKVLGSSGDVQLFQTTGVLDIKTTKGNQSGTRINLSGNSKFTSTEGKIKMRFDMPKESLKYQLLSEKAYIFALGKSKKKKLNIGEGSILVESSSTTGAQSYY
jgi:hypothetical protein